MSYQALARKWRPQNFQEMVGQPHVQKALSQAFNIGRIHHAYLFTGTRGVGKTTLARIIAKCLNCEQGVTATPCGHCEACLAIQEGRFFDLIEVDAASKTKVEETRALLENVPYAPTKGRYKVYLIDEAHMLSNHSFNALLKTLEEPPSYVVFILATTEPERMPATVLSRCLQFHLKHLSVDQMVQRLTFILEQEQISFDKKSLFLIARAAEGSLRDALSLLEQALPANGGTLREQDVYEMLGMVPDKEVLLLLDAIIQGNAELLMQRSEKIAEFSPHYEEVLAELIGVLQKIAILQCVPNYQDLTADQQSLHALALRLSKEEVQLYYQIALMGRHDLNLAPQKKGGFEMVLLRMLAFRPVQAQPMFEEPKSESVTHSSDKVAAVPPFAKGGLGGISKGGCEQFLKEWPDIVKQLSLTGVAKQLAAHSVLKSKEGKKVHLVLESHRAPLLNERSTLQIQEALSAFWGEVIELQVTLHRPENGSPSLQTPQAIWERERKNKIDSDVAVQAFLGEFEGKVKV